MNREQATFLLKNAVEERRAAKEAIRDAERSLAGLSDVIRGVLTMFPDLETGEEFEWGREDEEGEEVPRGAEAVRAILQSHPYEWFTVGDMLDELHNRHWLPESDNPANAVRAALKRAVEAGGGIEKGRSDDGRVAYRFVEEEPF